MGVTPLGRTGISLRTALTLALVLSACGSGTTASPSPAPSSEGATASPSGAASPGRTSCSNPYLPAHEGNRWKYSVSSNLHVPESYTDEIAGVGAHAFRLTSGEVEESWGCTPDGVAALAYGFGPTKALEMLGIADGYRTTDVQGVTLPMDLHVGSHWDQTFTVRSPGGEAGTVEITSDAVNEDAVALADAVFKTLRIESVINIHLVDGGETVDSSFRMFHWYDAGVGLFEILTFGSYAGKNMTITIKLDSFDVAGFA